MIHFYRSAFTEALGWTLVGSFWKMGSMWIAYLLITGNGKRWSAAFRYNVAAALMMAGTVWSFFALPGYYKATSEGHTVALFFSALRESVVTIPVGQWLMPFLSLAYVSAVIVLFVRMLVQYHRGRKSYFKKISPASEQISELADSLAKKIGIAKNVAIHLCGIIDTPLTIGFFRPVILLPVALFNQLSLEQASAVVAHELFHVRRNDYLVNIMVSISTVVLFFNPFASLFKNAICTEREHACDDGVVQLGFNNWQYAHALYILGKQAGMPSAFAMAATGAHPVLLERISRLIQRPSSKRPGASAGLIARILSVFFLCLGITLFIKKPVNQKAEPMHEAVAAVATPIVFTSEPIAPVVAHQSLAIVVPKELRAARKRNTATRSVAVAGRDHVLPNATAVTRTSPRTLVITDEENSLGLFASKEEPVHFTFVLAPPPPPPVPKTELAPMAPYVPSATFYYSVVEDSLSASHKVIHL